VLSNVVGFDDGPFDRNRRGGQVLLVGAVCARTRLDGVLTGRVRQDGWNVTDRIAALVEGSAFAGHIRAVLLGGITFAGFNIADIHGLSQRLDRPVLVVARRPPRLEKIRRALQNLSSADRRWRLLERAGPMEALGGVMVQRAGLTLAEAGELLHLTTLHGNLPEPLRLAHLIAGGLTTGHSRGRA
jgi:endonuclease V-like protein UPF0215 family